MSKIAGWKRRLAKPKHPTQAMQERAWQRHVVALSELDKRRRRRRLAAAGMNI